MLPVLGWICLGAAGVTASVILLGGRGLTGAWYHEAADWLGAAVVLLLGIALAGVCRLLPMVVAERERADEKARDLTESEQRNRCILETAVEAIVTTDERGMVESLNPAAEAMFGYPADEVIGRSVSLLMPSPHREHHGEYLERYLAAAGQEIIRMNREVQIQRKDGTCFPAEISVSEVRLSGRRLFTGIVRDMSERRAAEARLRAARERARLRETELARVTRLGTMGVMASGLAHEVSQPLSAIVNYTQACLETIRSGLAGPQELIEDLERIAEQAERAGEVVERIHNLIRQHQGQRPRGSVDLNEVVREAVELLSPALQAAAAELDLQLASDLPRVHADGIALEQVIINLAENALQAMVGQAKRSISIQTRADDKWLQFTMCDTGPGLPGGMETRVLSPFVTTKPGQMGVGLAISRAIIEAHGGKLWAASPGGQGATFRFALPFRNEC